MSFVRNRQGQISFKSGNYLLTNREKQMLQNSWAHFFAECIFPKIDEEPFAVLYSEKDSRPNTPVNVQIGALILKEYADDANRNVVIYHNRSEDTEKKIDRILRDVQTLLEQYPESGLEEVQLLKRVLYEQAVEEAGELRLRTKEDGGMNSSMLQSPFDPDAACRTKHGEVWHGYSANFMEAVGSEGSVIEDYDLQPNNYSDAQYLKDTLAKMEEQEEETTLVADGGYSGFEVKELAAEKGVEIVNTNLAGKAADPFLAGFVFSDDGTAVQSCPNGCKPCRQKHSSQTGQCTIHMSETDCLGCPHFQVCHPIQTKNGYRKTVSWKSKKRAEWIKERSGERFRQLSHIRNGVEAIPSLLRRKYRVDRMPVRGRLRCKMILGFKIAALNFRRLCIFQQGRTKCAQILKKG